jgi:predicted transcriptional regulator of viral defense system
MTPESPIDPLINELLAVRTRKAPYIPRAYVLGTIRRHAPDLVTIRGVADELGMSYAAARRALDRLWRAGWLRRVRRGVYAAIGLDVGTPTTEVEP